MPAKPKIWTKHDIPAQEETELAAILARVRAVRDALPLPFGTPQLPPDMDGLTFEGANDIERILLAANETIDRMKQSRVYSGEFQAGGF